MGHRRSKRGYLEFKETTTQTREENASEYSQADQISRHVLDVCLFKFEPRRLLSMAERNAEVDRVQTRHVAKLLAAQRSDGGWAQTDERSSDAFATGQALYALRRAGVDRSEVAIQSAIDFLVRTQQPEGTWPMTSRPNPENGKPATNLNPITYAATAWATLGLTSYVPGPSVQGLGTISSHR